MVINLIKKYKLLIIFSMAIPFWFLILFVGYFVASSIFFPIFSIILVILIFYFLSKLSKKFAIFISIITFLVATYTFVLNFEEDYCSKKGFEVEKNGPEMVVATKEDELALKEFDVVEGMQIGINFRTHMLCHISFNFVGALRDKYFFSN